MKKIKIYLVSVLTLVLTLSSFTPLYAKESDSPKAIIENLLVVSDTEQYQATMKDVTTDSHASIYEVVENGVSYRMIIDNFHNQVVINGIPYLYQQFEKALEIQTTALKNNQYPNLSEEYALVNIMKRFPVYRCTICGLSPVAAPSTGYTENYRYVGTRNARIEFVFTAAGYAAAAKLLGLPVPYVEKFFDGLLALGYIKNGTVNVHYSLYQCGHKKCPKAYKDKKVFEETGDTFYTTYYAFNPY